MVEKPSQEPDEDMGLSVRDLTYHWDLQISPWAAVIMIATLLALIPIGLAGWMLGILVLPVGIIAAAIVQALYSR
jgi:hypothetical protein